jgi:microcompartment protein CcmL/EutN
LPELGSRAFVTLAGDVAAVESAIDAGSAVDRH